MFVYVLNKNGNALMPCKPAKARHLLNNSKARVIKKTPFTIQLNWNCEHNVQPVVLGVDSGYGHIGISAVSSNKELFSAQAQLRKDMVKLNSEKRQYRRARRSRKTWHRKPRFDNRKKPPSWLAPSIQNKLDAHIKIIKKVEKILPIARIIIETAAFDIQKIKNLEIKSTAYQNGVQKGFLNVREYVLHRDSHTCQYCKGKTKDCVLQVHHLRSRQVGGNRPDNLITLCKTCHEKVSKKQLKLKINPLPGFRAQTFMSTVRWKIVDTLKSMGLNTSHTYGYITKAKRIDLGLDKSHGNDAFVIAGGSKHKRIQRPYLIKQVRKCNRKLFKGERSHIKNIAERFIHGFQRYDKVLWRGVESFVMGRRKTGYFDLRQLDGVKIHASAKAQELTLLESAKTLLIQKQAVPPTS